MGTNISILDFFRTALETQQTFLFQGKQAQMEDVQLLPSSTEHKIGEVDVPGTIIISVDYTNGGNVPQVRIRVWMDEAVLIVMITRIHFVLLQLIKYCIRKGEGSGTFGYAAIF
jgi:hypothetical protein